MSEDDKTPELEQEDEQIEEEEVEEKDDESDDSEDQTASELEELRKKNEELEARLRRQAKKKNKPAEKIIKTDDEPEVLSRVERLELSEKKRQFGYEHGLSPDETDKIFQINSNPTEETLKDPFVKAGLQAIRKQKRLNDNTPAGSGVSVKKGLGKDFKDLSPQEKQERYAKLMAQHRK